MSDDRPLIAHVVFRFDTGGLENGVVNLINQLPIDRYRHAVIALTEVMDFKNRIQRPDTQFFSLQKPPGHLIKIYPTLYRLFRQIRPAIVHTRNLAALEVAVPARLAGHPVIHGEHGRDIGDLDGSSKKYQWIRRMYQPFVKHYIALSKDLEHYLLHSVGIPKARVTQIYNGVDANRFFPVERRKAVTGSPFNDQKYWVIGTVGRMQTVKDQTNLARAFVRALQVAPHLRDRLRLVMIGEGPLRTEVQLTLSKAGFQDFAWLPGESCAVPEVMQGLDCFVLPSLAEGISNTILEAMSCGLPVIATAVGGNIELVEPEVTGLLVPANNSDALSDAIVRLAQDPDSARRMGALGRDVVETHYSLTAMVRKYQQLYDQLLATRLAQQAN